MVMPLQTKTIDPDTGRRQVRQPVAHAPEPDHGPRNEHLARALQIASVLQTTLDPARIVELFSRETQVTIPHDTITFEQADAPLVVTLGNGGPHSCTYRLVVSGHRVGQITLSRAEPFSVDETTQLEYLLCSLVYPMLNALKYKEALESARRDGLTGLYNRSAMDEAITREIQLARRHKAPLSLLVMDIDDFKSINDRFGHAVGDAVIQCVARGITDCMRTTDVVARYGGEEFTAVLNNTDHPGALQLARRICQAVEDLCCEVDGHRPHISLSLGVACLREGDTEQSLFDRADKALYQAKSEGKNCARFADVE
jgi:diguanylate cyclase (GGDEF)-like protein